MKPIGKLLDVVTLLRRSTPTASADAMNQPADVYLPFSNRPVERAAIIPLSGAEIEEAGQLIGTTGYRVEMRYREDVTTDAKLRVDSVATPYLMSIRSIPADPDGKRMRVWFLATREEEPA